jgi:hypothetical protein
VQVFRHLLILVLVFLVHLFHRRLLHHLPRHKSRHWILH